MSENVNPNFSGVPETLLIPLYHRAMESQRPDAIIKDEKAVALVTQMSYDFDQVRKIRMAEGNKVARIMLTREMDRYARDFLSRHPEAVVVHIGCGLDSRFERVDNSQVEWYDLDFPDIIDIRRKFIGDEGERYHLLGCSVLEDAWLEAVKVHSQHHFLFLAEGVFIYFTEAQVKQLVLTLRDHFPGAELVFDGWCHYSSGWVTVNSPAQSLKTSFAGDSGAARSSKAGARASTCSTSGASSTSLSRGWLPFAG
jgi:O-methyltransferase involved in polyketide biosynthesis